MDGSPPKTTRARLGASAEEARVAFEGEDEFGSNPVPKDPVDLGVEKEGPLSPPPPEGSGWLWRVFRRIFGR